MYSFVDSVATTATTSTKGSESFTFNGTYFEDLISGYRTLYTSGREVPERDIDYEEIDSRDGGIYKHSRYLPRTIIVGFQILSSSAAEFRTAFNTLLGALRAEDAVLIFNDETDKYITATYSNMGDIDAGRKNVIGEIEFTCLDPYKYSVAEYSVSPSSGAFTVNYSGTVPAHPSFHVDFSSECGCVEFMDTDSNILVVGNPEEADAAEYDDSQMIVDQTFTSYGTTVQSNWPANTATIESYSSNMPTQVGTIAISTDKSSAGNSYLNCTDYGSGTYWHGAAIQRTLPAVSGSYGAQNFYFRYRQRFAMGRVADYPNAEKQRGCFIASVSDNSGNVLCSVVVSKYQTGNVGYIYMYVNGSRKNTVEFTCGHANTHFGYNTDAVTTTSIKKVGGKFTFNVAGEKYTYTTSKLADSKAYYISFYFGNYSTRTALTSNGLYWAKFRADDCDTWVDVPNQFASGDELDIDGSNCTIKLNGLEEPELGALGNDWETLVLNPGTNTIYASCSDWATADPDCTMTYREVFL